MLLKHSFWIKFSLCYLFFVCIFGFHWILRYMSWTALEWIPAPPFSNVWYLFAFLWVFSTDVCGICENHSLEKKELARPPCKRVKDADALDGRGLEVWRTTGAKALFCLTADIILAGEKEKIPGAHPPTEGLELGTDWWGCGGVREGPTAKTKRTNGTLKNAADIWSQKRDKYKQKHGHKPTTPSIVQWQDRQRRPEKQMAEA